MARKTKIESQDAASESTAPVSQRAEPKTRRSRRMARDVVAEAGSNARIAETAAQQPASTPSASSSAAPRPTSKIAQVTVLLERSEGATLAELVEATGWLPHTTRTALTGLKKKGRTIAKDKRGEVTCYRIEASA